MVTEEEWSGEVAKSKRFRLLSPVIALGAFGLIFVPSMMAGNTIASGFNGYLVSVGLIMALMLPLAFGLVVLGERRQRLTDEKVRRPNDELSEAIAGGGPGGGHPGLPGAAPTLREPPGQRAGHGGG